MALVIEIGKGLWTNWSSFLNIQWPHVRKPLVYSLWRQPTMSMRCSAGSAWFTVHKNRHCRRHCLSRDKSSNSISLVLLCYYDDHYLSNDWFSTVIKNERSFFNAVIIWRIRTTWLGVAYSGVLHNTCISSIYSHTKRWITTLSRKPLEIGKL